MKIVLIGMFLGFFGGQATEPWEFDLNPGDPFGNRENPVEDPFRQDPTIKDTDIYYRPPESPPLPRGTLEHLGDTVKAGLPNNQVPDSPVDLDPSKNPSLNQSPVILPKELPPIVKEGGILKIYKQLEELFPQPKIPISDALLNAYDNIALADQENNLGVFAGDTSSEFKNMLVEGLPEDFTIQLSTLISEIPAVLQKDMNTLAPYGQQLGQAYENFQQQSQQLYILITQMHKDLAGLVEIHMVDGKSVQTIRSDVVLDEKQKNTIIYYQKKIKNFIEQVGQVQSQILQVAHNSSSVIYQNKSSAVSQIIEEYISQSLKEDEILLFYGIGPHVPEALVGDLIRNLKNQCESALMYYNEKSENAEKVQKLLDFLNKKYPEFFSDSQLQYIESASQELKTFFATVQSVETIARNMQNELSLFETVMPAQDVTAHKRSIIFFHAVQEDVVNSQMDQMMQQLKGIVSQKNAQSIAQMVDQTVQFLATIDAQRSELASFGKYGLSSNDIADIQGKIQTILHATDNSSQLSSDIESLLLQLETIQNMQKTQLQDLYKTHAYTHDITQQIEKIFSLQQSLRASMSSSLLDQSPLDIFFEIQNRMTDLLKSNASPVVMKERLTFIQNDLQALQQTLQDGLKTSSSVGIDQQLMQKLENKFGIDIRNKLQAMDALLTSDNQQDHDIQFMNLYVNKKLQYLVDQSTVNHDQVAFILDDLKQTVSSGFAHELSLYHTRLRALSVLIQAHIQHAMDAFEAYAKKHAITDEQIVYLNQMKKNILANNGATIEKDVNALLSSLTDSTKQEVNNLMTIMQTIGMHLVSSYASSDTPSSLLQSFDTLTDQLLAIGAQKNTILMSLLSLPVEFDVSAQNESLHRLKIIKEYYEQDYKDQQITQELFNKINETIDAIVKQVSPLLKDDQNGYDQNLEKYASLLSPAEQKILQTTVEKIGIFNREILSFRQLQYSFGQEARSMQRKMQQVITENNPSLNEYQQALQNFESSYQLLQQEDVKNTLQSLQNNYEQTINIAQEAMNRVSSGDVKKQIADQIKQWEEQKQKCMVAIKNYQDTLNYNEQTITFYQMLSKIMQGTPFDIVYDASRDVSLKSSTKIRLPLSRLIGLGIVTEEQSHEDDDDCSKKMVELYALQKNLDEVNGTFERLASTLHEINNTLKDKNNNPKNISTAIFQDPQKIFENASKIFGTIKSQIDELGGTTDKSVACRILQQMIKDIEKKIDNVEGLQGVTRSIFESYHIAVS